MPETPLKIVVLISGSGTNLQAIIDAIAAGGIRARICAVISNREGVKGLERASHAGIPTHVVDHKHYPDRDGFDRELQRTIDTYGPELVVLAGFMRILTEAFVSHYECRMLNIHPSLLPDFRGLNTHERVLEAGRDIHGVSVHYVTNELDSGPLIIQAVIDIREGDTPDSLAQRIHQQEHVIYPMVIGWIAEGRLSCHDNQPSLDGKALTRPARWIDNRLELPE